MNNFEYLNQSPLITILTVKSQKGDPEALFHLGKILWNQKQRDAAKFYLNEASRWGQIEAEQFLNNTVL